MKRRPKKPCTDLKGAVTTDNVKDRLKAKHDRVQLEALEDGGLPEHP